RDRRADHHREPALRPARHRHGRLGSRGHAHARGAGRPRPGLPRAGGALCADRGVAGMRTPTAADLEDIAFGAAVLGTGGGGDPYIGKLLARTAIGQHGPVTLIDLDEVPDDAHVITCGAMGAPTIVLEKVPSGEELLMAMR